MHYQNSFFKPSEIKTYIWIFFVTGRLRESCDGLMTVMKGILLYSSPCEGGGGEGVLMAKQLAE
ncbi:hypothetical protein A9993_03695 [Rahnella victoriana]|nr:hypothetical protein A9993_03695 [Rahnella victoriana]